MTEPPTLKPPKELDAIVDVVLAYKAKPKKKLAKARKKQTEKGSLLEPKPLIGDDKRS
jgi:hypothetical protein